jgi:hypothetical protein
MRASAGSPVWLLFARIFMLRAMNPRRRARFQKKNRSQRDAKRKLNERLKPQICCRLLAAIGNNLVADLGAFSE